jgi:hypothetical protein
LGSLVVKPSFVGFAAALPWIQDSGRSCESVPIECGAGSGALIVERVLALGLVNAVLGCPTPIVVRPLSRVERGILEGLIVALLGRLALAPSIRLVAGDVAGEDLAPFSIGLTVKMQGLTGQACLCGTDKFFEQAWTLHGSSVEPRQLLATLKVEVAHTRLSRSELNALSEGDAIVFEEFAAVSPSDPWPAQVRLGEVVVPARAYPDGSVGIEDGVVGEASENAKERIEGPWASDACPEVATESIKASALVDITAEIGTIQIRGADRAGVLRDLSIGSARSERVHLMVGDAPCAEGEILAIGDQFGVRVTRKLAG